MNTHIKIIIVQIMFLMIVVAGIYFVYPKAEVYVNGNLVKIVSVSAKVIIISENPDFTNPVYIDTEKTKNVYFNIKPGAYYWKSDNGIIESFSKKFTVNSEVGMKINRTGNESNLVNVGNVKINITKGEDGVFVGHIILEPEQSEKIDDKNESYVGRQTG